MMALDWITAAAEEIDQLGSSDEAAGWVRDVIAKHCPFMQDVAYMPVPRCETCKRWKRHRMASDLGIAQTGDCHVSPRVASINATRLDFGCVQWKAR